MLSSEDPIGQPLISSLDPCREALRHWRSSATARKPFAKLQHPHGRRCAQECLQSSRGQLVAPHSGHAHNQDDLSTHLTLGRAPCCTRSNSIGYFKLEHFDQLLKRCRSSHRLARNSVLHHIRDSGREFRRPTRPPLAFPVNSGTSTEPSGDGRGRQPHASRSSGRASVGVSGCSRSARPTACTLIGAGGSASPSRGTEESGEPA